MKTYVPLNRATPKILNISSAWEDIPSIILDIITRFKIDTSKALEFGVEYGYSTSALSNYFDTVIGVDTFEGDKHCSFKTDHLEQTQNLLKDFENIKLIKSDYKDFIVDNDDFYNLIHIDIVHDYEPTFECGEWAVNHANIVIFHDTESFPAMKQVCIDLSEKYNLEFYNYPYSHGLGILIKN